MNRTESERGRGRGRGRREQKEKERKRMTEPLPRQHVGDVTTLLTFDIYKIFSSLEIFSSLQSSFIITIILLS